MLKGDKSGPRPIRRTAQGVTDNLALAENMASQGLTDSAKQAYTTNADRGLTASLDAVLRSGAGGNAVGDLQDNYEQGISRLSLAEDQARINNFNTYMKANLVNANEDDLNWQVNQYAPWADEKQKAAQNKQEGMKNLVGGINTGFGAVAAGRTANTNPTAGVPVSGGRVASNNTFMLNPNPVGINYTPKSLATLNNFGLRPLTGYQSITGANNYNFNSGNNPTFSENWSN